MEEKIRNITITRQKRFWASMKKFRCYIDDQCVAEIGNGKTITFQVNPGRHELIVTFITDNQYIGNERFSGGFISNKIIVNDDSNDKKFYLKVSVSSWNGKGEFILIPQDL